MKNKSFKAKIKYLQNTAKTWLIYQIILIN